MGAPCHSVFCYHPPDAGGRIAKHNNETDDSIFSLLIPPRTTQENIDFKSDSWHYEPSYNAAVITEANGAKTI